MKNSTAAISVALMFIAMFAMSTPANAQNTEQSGYIKIEVDGLSCPFCAYGLEKKLKEIKGATDLFIELTAGEATFQVPKGKEPTEEELRQIVEDAGFTPREITFSDTPFKTKKDGRIKQKKRRTKSLTTKG